MKKTESLKAAIGWKLLTTMILCGLLFLTSCGPSQTVAPSLQEELWKNATYKADTELGQGKNNFRLKVETGEKSIVLSIHTEKATVGDALTELDLIAGDDSIYGLYVKVVNGITADYDVDRSYWSFYADEDLAPNVVENTPISAQVEYYRFVYTK